MMTPERFRQVRNLFEAVLEKPPGDRDAFLSNAAASSGDVSLLSDVARLLESHQRHITFLDGTLTAAPDLRTDPARMEGRRLGQFEVIREIGHGGMGTVYLARRADGLFEQQVAVKVVTPIHAAPEIVERFYQERKILASLDHPNIARLYDGGVTEDGWPYFAMEFVDGLPIDQWCDRRKLNVSDRIRLFRTVCEAVQSAHRHRVIHRDLKPGNILVRADGVVKLLDFGIAKLVRGDGDDHTVLATRSGMRLMTPEYASPEQVRQDEMTPLSDIYSLGVVLYELLTGRRPYHLKSRALHEILRAICETDASRPSMAVLRTEEVPARDGTTLTVSPGQLSGLREGSPFDLQRRLAGDLDGILLKTLKKDPLQRYRSVGQLSEDLERHLNGQPVSAAPEGYATLFLKRFVRHKNALVIASAILAALLSGGVSISMQGALWIGGSLALLGGWRWLAHRKMGEHFDEYGDASVGWLAIVAGLGWFVSKQFEIASGRIFFSILALILVYLLGKLAMWQVRERWAGKLLLQVPISLRERAPSLAASPLLYMIAVDFFRDAKDSGIPAALAFSVLGPILLLKILSSLVMGHLEIRDRGILFRGRLIPWIKIESCDWEKATDRFTPIALNLGGQKRERLRLYTRRVFRFLPPTRIPVASENVEDVTKIMDRKLALWPESH